MNRCALFISTLNEIEGLRQLFPQIPVDSFDECYALDGGSTDGTIEFFREVGIEVILEVKKGQIFNAGAHATDCEDLVFFAPDGNENPDDILRLLEKLREGYDMAIASRFMPESRNEEDGKLVPLRAWANRAFTLLVHLRWGGHLTDTINGFRAVKRRCVLEMGLEPTGFDIEFQMSIRGRKLGYSIVEIPTLEGDRIGGESTAYSIPTGMLMLRRYIKELVTGTRFRKAAATGPAPGDERT
jgi:glycosyltransferase involved in cell wall biosynthesis